MTFHLATYTAEKGLSWFYDKSAIDFAELDKCRRLLGSLPNFDAGDKGYEGIVAVGRRVFLIRCASAKAWDFKGRDATYITVTWLDRDKIDEVNLGAILSSDGMCQQSHDYKYSFDVPLTDMRTEGGIAQGVDLSRIDEEDVFIRRDFGEVNATVKIVKKGDPKMTEAEKYFENGGKAAPTEIDVASQTVNVQAGQKVEYSVGARVLGVVLFIALILLGTYLAKIAGHILLGYIAGFAGLGLLRVLWRVRR
ncbi:MAG: hypothetical protein IKP97_02910 [Kiritimatiellae bacterium]|nr:hypothetical protein [Kiritimatiellia bacterium]